MNNLNLTLFPIGASAVMLKRHRGFRIFSRFFLNAAFNFEHLNFKTALKPPILSAVL